jgi:hypothetical protein
VETGHAHLAYSSLAAVLCVLLLVRGRVLLLARRYSGAPTQARSTRTGTALAVET